MFVGLMRIFKTFSKTQRANSSKTGPFRYISLYLVNFIATLQASASLKTLTMLFVYATGCYGCGRDFYQELHPKPHTSTLNRLHELCAASCVVTLYLVR